MGLESRFRKIWVRQGLPVPRVRLAVRLWRRQATGRREIRERRSGLVGRIRLLSVLNRPTVRSRENVPSSRFGRSAGCGRRP